MWSDPYGQPEEAVVVSIDDDQKSPLLSDHNSLAIVHSP